MATIFSPTEELTSRLRIETDTKGGVKTLQRADGCSITSLPGNSFVDLEPETVVQYMRQTLLTSELDQIRFGLWFFATNSKRPISPLHEQIALGRRVVPTESAQLHLLWYHERVFIKPLPEWLLSSAFWEFFLEGTSNLSECDNDDRHRLYQAAAGFVRSWAFLITSDIDFDLAIELRLIPQGLTSEDFAKFIRQFRVVGDDAVSSRFHYGELRLSRLNSLAIMFLGRMDYFNLSQQYETYFARYFQSLLFGFGAFAVVLGAMQVALAAKQLPDGLEQPWVIFAHVCQWSSVATIAAVACFIVWLFGIWAVKLSGELVYPAQRLLGKRGLSSRT